MGSPMRVLIADDHSLVRDTIAAFVEAASDIAVDTVTNLSEALEAIHTNGAYDVVLLDYAMPGMDGLKGLETAISANGSDSVAILSGTAKRQVAQDAMEAGAIGFLPKTMGAKSLVNAIRFMSSGEVYVPASFMQEDESSEVHPLAEKLTSREIEVLSGLCKGQSNKEIARTLDLQEVTIKLHVKTLCRKLDARNRTQAAIIATEAGLF